MEAAGGKADTLSVPILGQMHTQLLVAVGHLARHERNYACKCCTGILGNRPSSSICLNNLAGRLLMYPMPGKLRSCNHLEPARMVNLFNPSSGVTYVTRHRPGAVWGASMHVADTRLCTKCSAYHVTKSDAVGKNTKWQEVPAATQPAAQHSLCQVQEATSTDSMVRFHAYRRRPVSH